LSKRSQRGNPKIRTLTQLLDVLEQLTKRRKDISLRQALEAIGHRSFGPLLLLGGLVMAAPGVGDIPGVPTGVGIFIALVAGQMLLRRQYVWFPKWLLDRSVSDRAVVKALGWLRAPARYVDFATRRRLVQLTHNAGAYAIAIACTTFAVVTPLMEVVLFSANIAGAAIVSFGVALVAHDGLAASCGFVLTAAWIATLAYFLVG
jgi:hypothetical protein